MSDEQEIRREPGEISRREFFKDAGLILGGAAISSTALVAAAPAPQTSTTPTAVPPAAGTTPAATAAPAAPMGGCTWNFIKKPDPIPDAQIKETITADVVILGGGNAGHLAALAAAQAGASVVVVEKLAQDKHWFKGQDFGCINSKFAASLGCPPVDVVEFINEFQRQAGNRANPELVRQYAERSGETLDWVREGVSADILDGSRIFMHPFGKGYTGELGGYKTFRGTCAWFNRFEKKDGKWNSRRRTWSDVGLQNTERSKKAGAKWYYGMQAEQLVKTGDAVTGAIAKDKDGKYTKFVAKKGVLLATGDFSGNLEMVKAYIPELSAAWDNGAKAAAGSGEDGMGLRMGMWAGGQLEAGPRATMGGTSSGQGPLAATTLPQFNLNGMRFSNEAANGARGLGSQASRQPKGMLCQIWDKRWLEYLEYQPADHGNIDISDTNAVAFVKEKMDALVPGDPKGGGVPWPGAAELNAPTGGLLRTVFCANTIEQLADLLGYKDAAKTTFLAQVKRYNELCKAGKDTDFGKSAQLMWAIENPPFYGGLGNNLTLTPGLVTLAGLITDGKQNVLDAAGKPIKGLYATGNCCGGRFQIQYATPVAGCSVGMACTLGRVAGENIAKLSAT